MKDNVLVHKINGIFTRSLLSPLMKGDVNIANNEEKSLKKNQHKFRFSSLFTVFIKNATARCVRNLALTFANITSL